MAALEIVDVSRTFPGGIHAVEDLSLGVEEGELVVLAGPSGCGKSTTLRMVAGLEKPTAGEIRLRGRVIDAVPPDRRNIAMVFQNHALYPHLSVRGNLEFPLRVAGTASEEIGRRVDSTARMLGLSGLMGRMPQALSGGERQRVALGRAIVRHPAALLLDEPLASLDAPLRLSLRTELKRVQRALGTPTLHVTHDQEEAMSLADRLVVMRRGRVQQIGRPRDVYATPANRFVAGFIGARGMNFVDGIVERREGRLIWRECGRVEDRRDGALTLTANGFTLCVPPNSGLHRQSGANPHVVLGIRPEHVRVGETADGISGLRGRIESIEALGGMVDVVVVTASGNRLIARLDAREDAVAGSDVGLCADMRDVCFFEPGETGMNLSLTNESTHAIA